MRHSTDLTTPRFEHLLRCGAGVDPGWYLASSPPATAAACPFQDHFQGRRWPSGSARPRLLLSDPPDRDTTASTGTAPGPLRAAEPV